MNRLLKIIVSCLLLLNGLPAMYGGIKLVSHPDGSTLSLSTDLLRHTPFHDYRVPGAILFIINGVFSLLAFLLILKNDKKYAWLAIMQGGILLTWIIIQVIMLRTIIALHVMMAAIAAGLLLFGELLRRSLLKVPAHQ